MVQYKDINAISFDGGNTIYRISGSGGGGGGSVPIFTTTCPAITPASGVATWVVTHNLGTTSVLVSLYDSNDTEVMRDVTITSSSQVTLTFKASSNISAGDYKVVVLTGTNPNNFIPVNTVLTIGSGASNNFSNIYDAISYLNGKYSTGVVTLQLDAGTFSCEDTLVVDGSLFNIPILRIIGNSENSTILDFADASDTFKIELYNVNVEFRNITFTCTDPNSQTSCMVLGELQQDKYKCPAHVTISTCTFTNFHHVLWVADNNSAVLKGNNVINNFLGIALEAQAASIVVHSSTLDFINTSNAGVAFSVNCGGTIRVGVDYVTVNYTNVRTVSNVTLNSVDNISAGYISTDL